MPDTPKTLLQRLSAGGAARDWDRWISIYEPWLRDFLLGQRLQSADADDVLQEAFLDVRRGLASFRHNGRTGAFRRWLRTILVHRVQQFRRQRGQRFESADWAEELADERSDLSQRWDREHDEQLVRRLLGVVATDFEPHVREAFRLFVLEDLPASEVARRTGMKVGAIYTAKCRVLARLREELEGLLDE